MSVFMAEILGTSALIFAVNMSGGSAAGIGLSLSTFIFTWDSISGANFNPAITISIYIREWGQGRNKPLFLLQIILA